MAKGSKKIYVVLKGRAPGIYDAWFGQGGAMEQVESFPGALYKGFSTYEEARDFAAKSGYGGLPDRTGRGQAGEPSRKGGGRGEPPELHPPEDLVEIYTDGGCLYNPGPGGYGVVVIIGGRRSELSGGYRHTTNNRMELLAGITGLKSLGRPGRLPVRVHSDSRYLVDGINKGWARRWRGNNWMRDAVHPAENIDLWSELLDLCERYSPRFVWVKGHAGNKENERCDVLARQAAERPDLPADEAYENGATSKRQPTLF